MSDIFKFQGHRVRFVGTPEKPEWVAADVIEVLYPDSKSKDRGNYLKVVPDEWKGMKSIHTPGGMQNMVTLFEPGVYRLLGRTDSSLAVPFQKWLFEEVLPTIRKTGRYDLGQQSDVYWYTRMKIAITSRVRPLPSGYFSIYERMMQFFSQLEGRLGYVVPDINLETDEHLVPDISIGLGFNEFLRSDGEVEKKARLDFLGSTDTVDFRLSGKNNNEVEYYEHIYPVSSHGNNNKRIVNCYPTKYASIFDYYLENFWIPTRFHLYISERDSEGYNFLKDKITNLPSGDKSVLKNTLLRGIIQVLLDSTSP